MGELKESLTDRNAEINNKLDILDTLKMETEAIKRLVKLNLDAETCNHNFCAMVVKQKKIEACSPKTKTSQDHEGGKNTPRQSVLQGSIHTGCHNRRSYHLLQGPLPTPSL